MIAEFEKFIAPKTVGNGQQAPSVTPPPVAPPPESNPSDDDDFDDQEDAEDAPSPANSNGPAEPPVTFESIKTGALELVRRIAEDLSGDVTLDEMETRLREELQSITHILSRIDFLKKAQE